MTEEQTPDPRLSGMRGYTLIWFGQLVSMLGTGMSAFALSFWIFEQTGQATALTIAMFCFVAPSILLSPLAGAIVDRTSRKRMLILTDLAAGLVTLAWLALVTTRGLDLWQVYVGNIIVGAFNSLQFPAFSAAVSLMIPKDQFGRAAGMMDFAGAASNILAPIMAGALIGSIGLAGILLVDVVTFLFAILTVAIIYIPQPAPESAAEGAPRTSLWQDSLFGFGYIRQRPSLLGMQFVFTALNFIGAFAAAVTTPMILARTGNSAGSLATVQSIAAFGGIAGGLLMSTWGGPKRRANGVLFGMTAESLLSPLVLGLSSTVVGWSIGNFLGQFFIPIINGSNQAIWQAKVPPAIQGRVFATRRMIAQISFPLALLFAGPVADRVFEPAMQSDGFLATAFGPLVGTGPGSGMALMLVFTGIIGAFVGIGGYLVPAVRDIEDLLPDFEDAPLPVAPQTVAQ